jgi:hypothetical protein
VIDVDPVDLPLQRHELFWIEDRLHAVDPIERGLQDQPRLHLRRRIADAEAQHETVELRLGQRKCTREILRILRGEHQKGLRQGQRLPIDRDLAVPHRLEQRRLGARAGAIDLVSQEHVTENGTLAQKELGAALIIDRHTDQVARQEIAGELDAVHLRAHGASERAGQRRLAHTRHVFDQDVAACQERDRRELDDPRFALERTFHDAPQLCQARNPFGLDGNGR